MTDESLQARLLQLFAEELEEHAQAMNADLLALEENPGDGERLRSLFRTAHTLKGGARAAGVAGIEQTCHTLEDRLAEIRDQGRSISDSDLEMLYAAADSFVEAARRLRSAEPPERALPRSSSREPESRRSLGPEGEEDQKSMTGRRAPDRQPPPPSGAASAPPGSPSAPGETRALRIAPERLDDLLASAAELLRLARRADAQRQELEALVDFTSRWAAEWRRHSRHTTGLSPSNGAGDEPDPLTAVTENLQSVSERSRTLARRATVDALQLARHTSRLAADIRLLRMRPFRELEDTLPRVVRDLASSAGKEVRLEFEGTDVEVDRNVLDTVREALLPILRNAVDHGIESPADRERLAKPPVAEIRIAAELGADRVRVVVEDDGAGIDADLLRQKYAAAGYPLPADDRSLGEALLGGGISSRARASVISGRGVGLDIVRTAMARVRGTVAIEWEAGRGTRVLLDFPPSLANLRALLVAIGSHTFAIPTSAVSRVLRLETESVGSLEGRPVISTDDGPVPVLPLARVLGPPLVERPVAGTFRAVMMGADGTRVAFVVDDVLAEEELILRPIPTGERTLPLIAGAAILGHGGVAPVLDAPAVMATIRRNAPAGLPVHRSGPERQQRRILVVDDSLTTRTLEQSVLEAAGFAVVTAADGLDALRVLQSEAIDLVVSDVEMPRLDGIRLCESIRANERLSGIPVILVTARERPEDRSRGMEAGADAYLPKSSFDQEQLLASIEQLLGE